MNNTYANKQALIEAYAKHLVISGEPGINGYSHAYEFAKISVKYNPSVYLGGWMIPGFGISAERVNSISK